MSNQSKVLQILESIGREEDDDSLPKTLNEAISEYKERTGKTNLSTKEEKDIEANFN